MNLEEKRLRAHRNRKANWKHWGPYLSERAWGTVREQKGDEDPWTSCTFDEAHKTVFRWGEDGIGGVCDRFQKVCFAPAFWNGKDPILKERLFGLSSPEGNHGEDVKERYFYLDALPTSSYLKMVYHYPIDLFPYESLREENAKRGLADPEYEIKDTGVFEGDRFFEITIEYAKEKEDDLYCRITVENKSEEEASLTLLPTVWLRNTWKFGGDEQPPMEAKGEELISHSLASVTMIGCERLLFCDNEEEGPFPKASLHEFVIEGNEEAVNSGQRGTKAAGLYNLSLPPKGKEVVYIAINGTQSRDLDALFSQKIEETDAFYDEVQKKELADEMKSVQRQAFAGMLFNRQFYSLDQIEWQKDGGERNESWQHLTSFDILSMPDKWEYPYFCSWDLAFHCLPLVMIDPDYAKRQLLLMTREWYMHPDGQFPAYEWSFSDVNPPVHAWALWRVYKIDAKHWKKIDRPFLEGCFHKLLLNFTFWVNKKDADGSNIFQGGFLGMDNISIFDRSRTLPTGGRIDQSDGSAWMSFYCISMMKISLHLAEEEPVYQDMATKFFEHFLRISHAITHCGGSEQSLWNEEDGFFYDVLHLPNEEIIPLKVRSLVGLLPLLAVETIDCDLMKKMPVFRRRVEWFISKRPEIASLETDGQEGRTLLSIVNKEQLLRIFTILFSEDEFLSPFGIRSLSKYHEQNPYSLTVDGHTYDIRYVPGNSDNKMYGGNSNWRGPIWFPINFLLIESLQRYHHYFGDTFKVEYPTGSGNHLTLWEIATDLSQRLISLIPPEEKTLFYEFYNPETGGGLGASHQTGWTGLVAKLIQQSGECL